MKPPSGKIRIPNPHPALSEVEIDIFDSAAPGTGTFTAAFKTGQLPPSTHIDVGMEHRPTFKIGVYVTPECELVVLLGSTEDTVPRDRAVFLLPNDIAPWQRHILRIEFVEWFILRITLDDALVPRKMEDRPQ
jgi:hypothetical protein